MHIARNNQQDQIIAGLTKYDLSENPRPKPRCIVCGQPADVLADNNTPLCGKCYLIAIGDTGEERTA